MRIDHRPANYLLKDNIVVSVIKGQVLVVLQKNLKTAKRQNGYMHHPSTMSITVSEDVLNNASDSI